MSVDSLDEHEQWLADIAETQGYVVGYPLIADPDMNIAKLYGMLPAEEEGFSKDRSAADNATVRSVFIIAPDRKIRLMLSYPMSSGRNFDEILRVLDSMQLTEAYKVATPVNWKNGDNVVILPTVSNSDAENLFPDGWQTVKPYMRIVAQPY